MHLVIVIVGEVFYNEPIRVGVITDIIGNLDHQSCPSNCRYGQQEHSHCEKREGFLKDEVSASRPA